jgi:hypothetical protein
MNKKDVKRGMNSHLFLQFEMAMAMVETVPWRKKNYFSKTYFIYTYQKQIESINEIFHTSPSNCKCKRKQLHVELELNVNSKKNGSLHVQCFTWWICGYLHLLMQH